MKIHPNVLILLICLAMTVFFTSLVVETQRNRTSLASLRNTRTLAAPDAFAVPPLAAGRRGLNWSDHDTGLSDLLTNGQQFLNAGNHEAAAKVYQAALEQQPDNQQALAAMGVVCFIQKDYEAAKSRLRRYFDLAEQDNPMLRMYLGVALMRQGKYPKALLEIQRVLPVAPEDETLNFSLACIHARLGDQNQAMAHLDKAFQTMGASILTQISTPDLDTLRDLKAFQTLVRTAMLLHQPETATAERPSSPPLQ